MSETAGRSIQTTQLIESAKDQRPQNGCDQYHQHKQAIQQAIDYLIEHDTSSHNRIQS